MRDSDFWSGCFFFILAVLVSIQSFIYDIGKWNQPGGGFLPFWVGVILACFSLVLMLQTISKGSSVGVTQLKGIRWGKWLLTLGSILAYAVFLEFLGFVLCTFLLIVVLLRYVEKQTWLIVLLMATVTCAGIYIIFQLVL